jgi:predicted transcriptional regulator
MSRSQRNQLFLEMREKELRLNYLAELIGCCPSLLSKYFSHKANLSPTKEAKLINLIHEAKQYVWQRVEVN